MSIQTNLDLHAYKKAMLSVSPEELVQFSKVMEKNISEEHTSKKSKVHHEKSFEKKKTTKSSKKSDKNRQMEKLPKKTVKKVKKSKKEKKSKSSSSSKKKVKRSPKLDDESKTTRKDSFSADSEIEETYLDLNVELKPLKHHAKDPKKLLEEVLSIVKGDKLQALVPEIARHLSVEELENKFSDYLEGMSSTRIKHVLEGKPMNSSSETDSSEEDDVKLSRKDARNSSLQANHVDSTTNHVTSSSRHRLQHRHDSSSSSLENNRITTEFQSNYNESDDEDVEMIEEIVEEQEEIIHDDVIIVEEEHHVVEEQPGDQQQQEKKSMTQLEELEFELRERAIRSLKKAKKQVT